MEIFMKKAVRSLEPFQYRCVTDTQLDRQTDTDTLLMPALALRHADKNVLHIENRDYTDRVTTHTRAGVYFALLA